MPKDTTPPQRPPQTVRIPPTARRVVADAEKVRQFTKQTARENRRKFHDIHDIADRLGGFA